MATIRVLIADDSLTVRRRMAAAISADAELEVVAEASDGRTVTELCHRLRPDVITMDVMMPVMDGGAATQYIMAHCATPILVVSASSTRGQVQQTCAAPAAGAIDVLEKPTGGQTIAQDQASSIVFGMPGEAIAAQAAQAVTPLAEVAPALCRMAGHGRGDETW